MLTLPPFAFARPTTIEAALDALATGDALLIAGGTDLLPSMKQGLFAPKTLVSLGAIAELETLSVAPDGSLVIGAGVTLSRLATDPEVAARCPALGQAAALVASPQVRNAASLGGNLCLDTRCPYYNQSEFWRSALGFCLKKDGDVCHVVPKGQRCVAAFSADTPLPLIAYGASVVLRSRGAQRTLPLRDLYVADGVKNTVRADDELLTAVVVPPQPSGTRAIYRKLRVRQAIDFPALSVAVCGRQDAHGNVVALNIVVGAIAAAPRVIAGLDALAVGRKLERALIERVAEHVRRQCQPLKNIDLDPGWRREVLATEVTRALEQLSSCGPSSVAFGANPEATEETS